MTTLFDKADTGGSEFHVNQSFAAQKTVGDATPSKTATVYHIGDSLSVGLSGASIVAKYEAKGYKSAFVRANSGYSISQMQPFLTTDANKVTNADVIVIELGTNNYSADQSSSEHEIKAFMAKVHSLNTGASVYWVDCYAAPTPGAPPLDMSRIDGAIFTRAKIDHFKVLSWAAENLAHPGKYHFDTSLGVHPEGDGYLLMGAWLVANLGSGGATKGAGHGGAHNVPVPNIDYKKTDREGFWAFQRAFTSRMMDDDEYEGISFRGLPVGKDWTHKHATSLSVNVSKAVTDVALSLANDQVSQLTFTIEDPNFVLYKQGIFQENAMISWRGMLYNISSAEVAGGSSGLGGNVIYARPTSVQMLKHKYGPLQMQNALASDFVVKFATGVGMKVVVQESKIRTDIFVAAPIEGHFYLDDEQPSVWNRMVGLAQEQGYMIFECFNVLFFGEPTWLYKTLTDSYDQFAFATAGFYWEDPQTELDTGAKPSDKRAHHKATFQHLGLDLYVDPQGIVLQRLNQVPQVTYSEDQTAGLKYTCDFTVPVETSPNYWIGQRCLIRGLSSEVESQKLYLTKLDYSLAGNGDCTITAETPLDPRPPSSKVKQGGPGGGGTNGHLKPGTYGGFHIDSAQARNINAIYDAAILFGEGNTGALACLDCAAVESDFYMQANKYNPESLTLPHDRVGSNGGSVGVYQQQVTGAAHSTGSWGTTRQLMDIPESTRKFLTAWVSASGSTFGLRVQDVQQSNVPGAYDAALPEARAILTALLKTVTTSGGRTKWTRGHPLNTKANTDFVAIAMKMVAAHKPFDSGHGGSGGSRAQRGIPPSAFDAASLVQWCAIQVGIAFPWRDLSTQLGVYEQRNTTVSVRHALNTVGAVVINAGRTSTAICVGDGKSTIEADPHVGVVFKAGAASRWSVGALIPDMHYLRKGAGPGRKYAFPVGGNQFWGRTDQGVDFTGTGPIFAMGDGTIRHTGTDSGWGPSSGGASPGTWLLLQLDIPQDSQHTHIYYAEGITQPPRVNDGERVRAGQHIADANGNSIEIGWAAPPGNGNISLARLLGQSAPDNDNLPEGRKMRAFMRFLAKDHDSTKYSPV